MNSNINMNSHYQLQDDDVSVQTLFTNPWTELTQVNTRPSKKQV